MAATRPVTDLRDNFADVTRLAHEMDKPVILTDEENGELVLMSRETLQELLFNLEVDLKLQEAEWEEDDGDKLYGPEDAWRAMTEGKWDE